MCHQVPDLRIVRTPQQQTVRRNLAQHQTESAPDILQGPEDVSVIEFQAGHHSDLGQVVEEFRSLVKEGRVVFVTLDDEGGPRRPQRRRVFEIERLAADQPTTSEPGPVQEKGGQCRYGGLSVGAAAHNRLPGTEHVVLHPFGQAQEVHSAGQGGLDLRVPAAERIADHHQIGVPIQVLCAVPFISLHAEGFDHFGGRWIEGTVRTSHLPSGFQGKPGPGYHGRSSDAAEVDGRLPLLFRAGAVVHEHLEIQKTRARDESAERLRIRAPSPRDTRGSSVRRPRGRR